MNCYTMINANEVTESPHGFSINYKVTLTDPSNTRSESGYALSDIIKNHGPLDFDTTLTISIAIAEALLKAQIKGLTIKDLKPDSIILKNSKEVDIKESVPEILLKARSKIDGKEHIIAGSPAYMSPEAATGLFEGPRQHVYSLGAIMYTMITGHAPYTASNPHAVLAAVKMGPPTRIVSINPHADISLVAICEQCMNRWLRYRYSSISEVLSSLNILKKKREQKNRAVIKKLFCSLLSICF